MATPLQTVGFLTHWVSQRKSSLPQVVPGPVMSASDSSDHEILHQVARDFETLAEHLEKAIQMFADDDSGVVDVAGLRRAREAALNGATLAREALSSIRGNSDP